MTKEILNARLYSYKSLIEKIEHDDGSVINEEYVLDKLKSNVRHP